MSENISKENRKPNTKHNKLDHIVELSLLYDFYGALLKDNQRLIYEDYILNDLSLSEIAATQDMTRQGVYDIVRRCSKQLLEYEEKLNLIDKFFVAKEMTNRINQIAKEIKETHDLEKIQEIERLSTQILEEF
ncbi:signal recognition particle associated protein [Lachnospiraceae bacterium KM106-2]|nr:signal recognition particle associated protein [Lachnospiraceae bacterium KM106-2]